jgi:hypothetical protein
MLLREVAAERMQRLASTRLVNMAKESGFGTEVFSMESLQQRYEG